MGIVQQALSKLLAPSVAQSVSAALDPLRARVSDLESRAAALEARPGLTDADRTAIAKAAAIAAEIEALAEGTIEVSVPAAAPADTVTVPEIQQ